MNRRGFFGLLGGLVGAATLKSIEPTLGQVRFKPKPVDASMWMVSWGPDKVDRLYETALVEWSKRMSGSDARIIELLNENNSLLLDLPMKEME